MFKCIKDLLLNVYDDDGFEVIEDQYMKVKKDSEWFIDEGSYRFIDGEIRLENDDAEWIEIDKSTFKEHFIEVQ